MALELRLRYDRETDIRDAAARLWVDAIIDPAQARDVLSMALDVAVHNRELTPVCTGGFQVYRAPSSSVFVLLADIAQRDANSPRIAP